MLTASKSGKEKALLSGADDRRPNDLLLVRTAVLAEPVGLPEARPGAIAGNKDGRDIIEVPVEPP